MNPRRNIQFLKAFLGLVLSARVAVEPLWAGASQNPSLEQPLDTFSDNAPLESRARVLVRAARALSRPGALVNDELLKSALTDAAKREGLSARSGVDHSDWAMSFVDPNFATILERVMRDEKAHGEIEPAIAPYLVETLSGWDQAVDASTIVQPKLVVKISDASDIERALNIKLRFPGANVLIWADEATARAVSEEYPRWRVAVPSDSVFSNGTMKLKNVPASLPKTFRDDPGNLAFVLPEETAIDDSGLPGTSAWRRVRLLIIVDPMFGTLRVTNVLQKMSLDRVASYLTEAHP